ncbi:hypothetical protein ACFYY1_37075 [Streptomyces sp. NPDC001890]|uniref:hypothetical protein n=1 Tax=Streptomyces sp. NPDC001890 TaxID=3364620 RepID=UPI0036B6F952
MPTFLIVTAAVSGAFLVWFCVGLWRVSTYQAKNVFEGMAPQRLVYRRLSRQIRREHGR